MEASGAEQTDAEHEIEDEGVALQWTIDNKYYTAAVHFLAKTPALPPAKALWPPGEEDAVPAIIYVFNDGEVGDFPSLPKPYD